MQSGDANPMTGPTPQAPLIQGIDIISNLEAQTEPYLEAFFSHCIAPDALKIYKCMEFASDEKHDMLEKILEKFDEFTIIGRVNETCDRYMFFYSGN